VLQRYNKNHEPPSKTAFFFKTGNEEAFLLLIISYIFAALTKKEYLCILIVSTYI